MTWRFCEIHSIIILAISQLHRSKTSADTNKLNQLYMNIYSNEFQLSMIEGVFFLLLHEFRMFNQTATD